eukprot:1153556-Pelagomonas_calceolata.AAC.6
MEHEGEEGAPSPKLPLRQNRWLQSMKVSCLCECVKWSLALEQSILHLCNRFWKLLRGELMPELQRSGRIDSFHSSITFHPLP